MPAADYSVIDSDKTFKGPEDVGRIQIKKSKNYVYAVDGRNQDLGWTKESQ